MRVLTTLIFIFLISCRNSPGFSPPNKLNDNRIIGAMPEIPQIKFPEKVKLKPVIHLEESGAELSYNWSACPISQGSSGSYKCIDPACEKNISVKKDGSIEDNPHEHLLSCLSELEKIGSAKKANVSKGEKLGEAKSKTEKEDRKELGFIDFVYRLKIKGLKQNPVEMIHRQRIFNEEAKGLNRKNPELKLLKFGSVNLLGKSSDQNFDYKYGVEKSEEGKVTKEYLEAIIETEVDLTKAENDQETDKNEYILVFFSDYGSFERLNMLGAKEKNRIRIPADANGKTFNFYLKLMDSRGGVMIYGPYKIKPPKEQEIEVLKEKEL